MMDSRWADDVAARLKKVTKLPVRIRPHPGNDAPKRALAEDLKGAAMVVVWTSSCGVHALVEGIPVVCEAPYWIGKGAAGAFSELAGGLPYRDKRATLHALAWAQWTCAEISTGEPFKVLLQ